MSLPRMWLVHRTMISTFLTSLRIGTDEELRLQALGDTCCCVAGSEAVMIQASAISNESS